MNSLDLPDKFVIYDLEWTAWKGSQARMWTGENEYREIFDIGGVMVEGNELNETKQFRQLVTLEIVPELPTFSTELTGITQQEINEGGVPFSNAINNFAEFADDEVIYCWGRDYEIIIENCGLKNISYPFSPKLTRDIRFIFARAGIKAEDYMSSTILEAFDQKEKVRREHQGLNDARSILDALRLLSHQ